jgi:hypothetical protein
MVISKKYLAGFFAIVLSVMFAPRARSASDDLVRAANKEASLLLYGGATLQHMTLLIGNFNRVHPGIKVNYLRKSGSSLFELIVRERGRKLITPTHMSRLQSIRRCISPNASFCPAMLPASGRRFQSSRKIAMVTGRRCTRPGMSMLTTPGK